MIAASANFLTANTPLAKKPVYIVTITGYSRAFATCSTVLLGFSTANGVPIYDWLTNIQDHSVTVNDLSGSANLADLVFSVQDSNGAITGDFPGFVFEGKQMQLWAGFEGLAFSDFVPLFSGEIDSIESSNLNTEYTFTCPDVRQELAAIIYTLADDAYQTSSNHPRTVNGHPLDILLSVLETEIGLSASAIDVAKITLYRNTIFNGMQFDFSITTPPVAKDFIDKELMMPLGAYLWTNNLGQITVNFYYPLNPTPVLDFNVDNVSDVPEAGQSGLINEVVMRFDDDGTGSAKYLAQSVTDDSTSIAKYGLFGQHIIEGQGVRSGFQGFLLSVFTSYLIFIRYGDKQLCHGDAGANASSSPINALWSTCLVEPGDIVTQTNPHIPDRLAGIMGVSGKTFVVMDRTWQFFTGIVQLKLLAVDLSKFKQYFIAPDPENPYPASSPADQARYLFLSNDSDQYSNGHAGNTLS